MKTLNPIATTLAVLFTLANLFAVTYIAQPSVSTAAREVFVLPGIEVHPTAQDRRAASILSEVSLDVANSPFTDTAQSAASLLGTQLTMPYYSFGFPILLDIGKE